MRIDIRNGQCNHVEIYNYPDGQKNIKLDMSYFNNAKYPVEIYASIRNFSDLEIIFCIVRALRKNDFVINILRFNYLFGLRSDRAFELGMPNYVRDVLIPLLRSLQVENIQVLAPHNMNAFEFMNITELEKFPPFEGLIAIGADESTVLRQNPFRKFSLHFHKKRVVKNDKEEIEISLSKEDFDKIKSLSEYMPLLIVDDLCDGGATFVSIAAYLNEHFPERIRFLYVTHGLFTKGIDHVLKHYDKIITTNSYQDFESNPKLEVLDVWS